MLNHLPGRDRKNKSGGPQAAASGRFAFRHAMAALEIYLHAPRGEPAIHPGGARFKGWVSGVFVTDGAMPIQDRNTLAALSQKVEPDVNMI